MSTRVRSYSKINLGLAIGPAGVDGFHPLTTLYQTIEAHDVLTISAEPLTAGETSRIVLSSNDRRVPLDGRNTVWKMLERTLATDLFRARGWVVRVHIDKRLPMQGGLGAGSANAAAALLGLERETGLALAGAERLRLASEVGSDVPLFLIGGAVLGLGRGEQVYPMPDLAAGTGSATPEWPVVLLALPGIGVSTPQAFRAWDAQAAEARDLPPTGADGGAPVAPAAAQLTQVASSSRLEELSRALAAVLSEPPTSSGVLPPDMREDHAGHTLPALVRTGIRNDFEEVVFRQHPLLGTIKRALLGPNGEFKGETALKSPPVSGALYAALSGSGSALFGLYADKRSAAEAESRLHALSVRTLRTRFLSRAAYWEQMLASE